MALEIDVSVPRLLAGIVGCVTVIGINFGRDWVEHVVSSGRKFTFANHRP